MATALMALGGHATSRPPCGGAHVCNLAEIGRIKVLRNQRVEIGFA